MNRKWTFRRLGVVLLIGAGQMGCTLAQPLPATAYSMGSGDTAVATPDTSAVPAAGPHEPAVAAAASQSGGSTPDEAHQSAGGNVAELQRLIRQGALTELRTTYNASYGASLLFDEKESSYWVVLFQQKTFWRAIKTSDSTRADLIYRNFVRQTVQLSDVEIRRTQLEAQKAFTERLLVLSQERANRLQADLEVAQKQQQVVADQQKTVHEQASALQAEKTAAQARLRDAQRTVRDLQQQLEMGLPPSGR